MSANIFSLSIDCLLFCWLFLLLCKSFFVWCSPTHWLLILLLVLLMLLYPKYHCQDWCKGAFPFEKFSSKSFIVLGFTFMSLIHFKLIFINGIRVGVQFHSSACRYPVFPALFIKETIFPHYDSWLPCQILIDHVRVGLFLGSWFCSFCLCTCFFASTILFWLK